MNAWLQRRRQRAELLVTGALTAERELSGYPLMKRTGLRPGRLYTALSRMEADGRIVSRWADGPYPRRRLYRLNRRPA